jgi:hypothetical protein
LQFRGDDEEGLTGENELAKMIAKNGNQWSSKNWRKEDMVRHVLYLVPFPRLSFPFPHSLLFSAISQADLPSFLRSQTAYMFRLYLEWARLVSPKRGLMDFEFTTEPVIVPVGAGPNHRSPRTHAHQLALEKLRIMKPPAVQQEEEIEE